MNDAARELLVKAALDGVKQVRGRMTDGQGGYCAHGILYSEFCRLYLQHGRPTRDYQQYWGLSDAEHMDITHRNDDLGQDFLTIARKVGVTDAPA